MLLARLPQRPPANAIPKCSTIQFDSATPRSSPANCGTREYPSHGFQFFYFNEAPSALPKVLLASQRTCRVQFSAENRMENEVPFRTGASVARAGSRIMTMHRLERQPASGLTMTFPFIFGWIEHK